MRTIKQTIMKSASVFIICAVMYTGGRAAITDENSNVASKKYPVDPVVETLIDGIRLRESSIKSGEGYFIREDYFNDDPFLKNAPDKTIRTHANEGSRMSQMFWALDDRKIREDVKVLLPESQHFLYTQNAYNGERTRFWFYGSENASEFSGNQEGGGPLGQISYVLQVPRGRNAISLSHTLEEKTLKLIGKEQLNGINAYHIQTTSKNDPNITEDWWVSPDYGYIVLKHEQRNKTGNSVSNVTGFRTDEYVDEIQKVDNEYWMPTKFRTVQYVTFKGHPEIWTMVHLVSKQSLSINNPVPSGTFDLDLPIGTQVVGTDKQYVVGGDVSELRNKFQTQKMDGHDLNLQPLGVIK